MLFLILTFNLREKKVILPREMFAKCDGGEIFLPLLQFEVVEPVNIRFCLMSGQIVTRPLPRPEVSSDAMTRGGGR